MSKVLVTGSAGAIGKAVVKELLARGHWVRGLDRRPTEGAHQSLKGNITDAKLLRRAVKGMDAVVHQAATVDDADFLTDILPNNIIAVYNLFEAARLAGVKRLVLASTAQTAGYDHPKDGTLIPTDVAIPFNYYTVSKLFAEDLGRMYANRHKMSVIFGRVVFLPRANANAQHLIGRLHNQQYFCSHDDAGRFFADAVEAKKKIPFAVCWVVSKTGKNVFDMAPSRKIVGFKARDTFPQGLPFEVVKLKKKR
jgi:uronate dehydrogenase